jgi:hypothetical protein
MFKPEVCTLLKGYTLPLLPRAAWPDAAYGRAAINKGLGPKPKPFETGVKDGIRTRGLLDHNQAL